MTMFCQTGTKNSMIIPQLKYMLPEQIITDSKNIYALHVIITPLSFLMRDALNSNIFWRIWLDRYWLARSHEI